MSCCHSPGRRRLIVPIHPGFGGSDDDLRINAVLDYVVPTTRRCSIQLGLHDRSTWFGHSLGAGSPVCSLLHFSRSSVCAPPDACLPGGAYGLPEHPGAEPVHDPAGQAAVRRSWHHRCARQDDLGRVVTVDMKVARYREMTSLSPSSSGSATTIPSLIAG